MVYNLYIISFDLIQYPFNIYITVNTIYLISYCNHQSIKQYLSTINPIKVNPTRNSYVWTQRGELTHLSIFRIPSDQHSAFNTAQFSNYLQFQPNQLHHLNDPILKTTQETVSQLDLVCERYDFSKIA